MYRLKKILMISLKIKSRWFVNLNLVVWQTNKKLAKIIRRCQMFVDISLFVKRRAQVSAERCRSYFKTFLSKHEQKSELESGSVKSKLYKFEINTKALTKMKLKIIHPDFWENKDVNSMQSDRLNFENSRNWSSACWQSKSLISFSKILWNCRGLVYA